MRYYSRGNHPVDFILWLLLILFLLGMGFLYIINGVFKLQIKSDYLYWLVIYPILLLIFGILIYIVGKLIDLFKTRFRTHKIKNIN